MSSEMTNQETFINLVSKSKFVKLYQAICKEIYGLIAAIHWKILESKHVTDYPKRFNCVAVVTGSTKNSEVFLIKELIKVGYFVIVGTKNPSERLNELTVNKKFDENIVLIDLDVGSLKSVKKFVNEIDAKYPYDISLLVNNFNASFDEYKLTTDGFESNIAANYFGHFYLTHLLLKNLKTTSEDKNYVSRVVNVLSPDFFGTQVNFNDVNNYKEFNPNGAYARSKQAQLTMSIYLDKLMTNYDYPVKFYAVNCGFLDSSQKSFMTRNPLLRNWILVKPSESTKSILYVCLSEDLDGGTYLSNCSELWTPPCVKNEFYQEKLFGITCELLKIDDFMSQNEEIS